MQSSQVDHGIVSCTVHWQVQQRYPIFDQMIINGYQPGEGIKAHVDLLKFADGISIVSLGAPAVMTFTKVAMLASGNTCRYSTSLQLLHSKAQLLH